MSIPPRRTILSDAGIGMLGSPRFAHALTVAIVGAAYFSFTLRNTMGWPGLIAIVSTLVVVAAASITVKRRELEWQGLLPISLLAFLGWSALSIAWSDYQWVSLGSILYQIAFAFLAVYIALTRDLIQLVRAFGDVLRVLLALSLVLEVLAGVLLDVPIAFLQIAGNLGVGGPIQGVVGSRNQLGLVALIGLVTFVIELRTRSVRRPVAVASIVVSALAILFARSPVTFGVLGVVALAGVALVGLRRATPEARRAAQFSLLAAVVVGSVILFAARSRVIPLLNAGGALEFRIRLWQDIVALVPLNTLEGFGWAGYWRTLLPPYFAIDPPGQPHGSALNAFLDVLLQLGLVGLVAFIALVGLALVRSWLLASNKRSVVYVWPALVLVVLLVTSAAESSVLVEFGWLTLVVCALVASRDLSWRERLDEARGQARST